MSQLDTVFGIAGVAFFVGSIGGLLALAAICELAGRIRRGKQRP